MAQMVQVVMRFGFVSVNCVKLKSVALRDEIWLIAL